MGKNQNRKCSNFQYHLSLMKFERRFFEFAQLIQISISGHPAKVVLFSWINDGCFFKMVYKKKNVLGAEKI